MATAIELAPKAKTEPCVFEHFENNSDLLTFNQNSDCLIAYQCAKDQGKIDVGKNLHKLFSCDSINEARYYVRKLNLDFEKHFQFTLTLDSDAQKHTLKLYFTQTRNPQEISFSRQKSALVYPLNAGLPNLRLQHCYANAALQCFCGFLHCNPVLDYTANHLPQFYAENIIKKKFPNIANCNLRDLAQEIHSNNLENLAVFGFTSKNKYEGIEKPFKIDCTEFMVFHKMIQRLIKLTSILNQPTSQIVPSQVRDVFLSSYAELITTYKLATCFIKVKQTKSGLSWEFTRTGNATKVITELKDALFLDCLEERFNVLQSQRTSPLVAVTDGDLTTPTIIRVNICLPKTDESNLKILFSLDNFFLGSVTRDRFDTPTDLYPITRFMCDAPPEKLLVTFNSAMSKKYTTILANQINTLFHSKDLELFGVLPLIEALKNNLKVKVPLARGTTNTIDKRSYSVDHVICNSGSHYSILKFTQQGEMIHIDDTSIRTIPLTKDNQAAIAYVIDRKLRSSTFSLHFTPTIVHKP